MEIFFVIYVCILVISVFSRMLFVKSALSFRKQERKNIEIKHE